MKPSDIDMRWNKVQHQRKGSECGVYSINFITRLASGESFDSVINNITKDEQMNANRKIYFRNVN
jgi:Ulp1 family protease